MTRNLFTNLLAISILVAACGAPAPASSGGPLKVVATFSVIGDFVHTIGGEQIDLTVLVGPGVDTHTFEPNPRDSKALAEAGLIFENGLGFETWLDDLYLASGATTPRIVVTQGIEPRESEEAHAEGTEEAEHEGEEGHDHGEFDPHAWHSVANAVQMTKNVRDALVRADPGNAATYQANADAYLAQLQELDTWVFDQVKPLPENRRKLLTPHDTFGYFAQRYGFDVIGTVLPTSTEGASPSAQELAALVETLKSAGVPAVFAENVSANTLLQQVADEAGVSVVVSLYTDALGPVGSAGDTYIKMMRYNVHTIVSELGK